MRWLSIAIIAGCGAAAVAPPASEPLPGRLHAPYELMPGELGDPGIVELIPHHARLLHRGLAFLGLTSEPFTSELSQLEARPVVSVLGENRAFLRVVSSSDDAALALWIEREDVATTIVAPARLGDETGRVDPIASVTLDPGVDVDVGRQIGDLHEVTLRDPALHVSGWARTEVLGAVWVGLVPPVPAATAGGWLVKDDVIRVAPRSDAPVLAVIGETMDVGKVATSGAWIEVEVRRPGVRVRGFVPASHLDAKRPFGGFEGHGSGTGHGYGISDTDKVVVPAGACLYDRDGGEVIGVNTKEHTRYGFHEKGTTWGRVYVETEWWGLVTVAVHEASPDTWESCLAH